MFGGRLSIVAVLVVLYCKYCRGFIGDAGSVTINSTDIIIIIVDRNLSPDARKFITRPFNGIDG